MLGVIIGLVAIVLGASALLRRGGPVAGSSRVSKILTGKPVGVFLVLIGGFMLMSTSFIFVDANSVGHLKRIYAFKELPQGRIIALEGEKGPQAQILGPGFHFIPLVRVIYDFEEWDVISIPEGYYGQLTALDGDAMPSGMFMAPAISDSEVGDMLKAESFLTKGGLRGPQETVLKPGQYRLNRYLFDLRLDENTNATIIPAGHVGVVKSNVSQPGINCVEEEVSASTASREALTVPLVPRGCVGIWKEPLFPGAYYLNRQAYEVTLVDTRVQTWEYKGGYTKRIIDLSVDQQGNIQQNERSVQERIPDDAADRAVYVKVEGWDIPLELRALVQVDPTNAPVVVGSVGGLGEIENRILTPAIRSIVRNVAGASIRVPDKNADGTPVEPAQFTVRPTRVLDLIENRDALEQTIEQQIKIEGNKAGVNIREIRLGEPAIPPELLVSRLRVQLADQLSTAYERETDAQQKRIETEQARSTADEQPRLVEAQIAVQVANQREQERAALGRAERQYLEELARGQRAQVDVLGQDRVALLQALEKLLTSLERKPELVGLVGKLVPNTVVGGDGAGLAGAAALLGASIGGQSSASGSTRTPSQ
ncbi:SPFH domain-containing protein [Roseibium alexandrii]|uniref:SPFH domain-containing protein n=1 Tax=Roseibium alexandrii TaxID=388408 RepID=UPI00375385DF